MVRALLGDASPLAVAVRPTVESGFLLLSKKILLGCSSASFLGLDLSLMLMTGQE